MTVSLDLGFDIDGVIADFVKDFLRVVKNEYDLDLTEQNICYHDLYQVLGVNENEAYKLIKENLLKDLDMIPGAKKTLKKLHADGHQIHLLTARPRDFMKTTKNWLKKKGIPYSSILYLNEGEKHLTKLSLDLVVEDNLKEAIRLLGKVKHILIFDHPWNKSYNVREYFKRVYSWNDILAEIKYIEENYN